MKHSKENLIQILVNDFKNMFPNSTRAEQREVFLRLQGFTVEQLSLLVSQVPTAGAPNETR